MTHRWMRLLSGIIASSAGSAMLHGQQIAYSIPGSSASELAGTVVVRIHDHDLDGVDDLAIGAPGFDCGVLTNCGAVRIASGKTGSLLGFTTGASALERFGSSITAIDDVTGDGIPDLAVGAPGFGGANPNGAIRIVNGSTFISIGIIQGPSVGARIGERVVRLADQNGDGRSEIATGGRGASPGMISGAGSAYVFDPTNGQILKQFDGASAFEAFGTDISTLDDVTGDGRPELVIGSPGDDPFGNNGAGSIAVVDPVGGATLRTFFGLAANDGLGVTCAGLDDLDADGFPDVLGGAPGATVSGMALAGTALALSFVTGAVISRVDGQSPNDMVGRVLARLDDIDGDGVAEFAIGSPSWSVPGKASAGRITLYSGQSHSVLYQFVGAAAGSEYGGFIGPLGDLNSDQRPDFAIGWTAIDTPFPDAGVTEIRLGQSPSLSIVSTGMVGTNFELNLQGKAGNSAFLLVAAAPATIPTVFGLLCLSLTPTPLLVPLPAFSATGSIVVGGTIPPIGAVGPQTAFLQPALVDLQAPGGGWLGECRSLTIFP